ncbi:MAG: M12 family metallo-peptidase, partial [Bacteroidota bacterium]|nr:M12 family metallo-peptidase [Bacteroidota bacterium]
PQPLRESGLQTLSQPLAAAKTCVVAIDEDYACYQEFGNNVDYITARLAAITTVYESEIGVAMSLGPFNCWTTPDPYNGSGLDPLLQSFTNYWVSNHQGDADQRTLAHLISRRIGGGGASGIAWVGGMCRPGDIGYGLTNISGTMTGVDEAVMAHELGHNVGSQHTHNCAAYPPSGLDHCVAAEGGCSWTPVQSLGCIMSYCNNKTFSFDTPNDHRVVTTLQDAVDQATCLASLAQIKVNDTAVTFAKTDFGSSRDTTLTAIVTSTGSEADLKIIGMTIGGTDANAFTIKKHPQFPVVLTNGQSINVTITFSPNYGGDLTGQLQILHNATGGSSVVNLYGHSATPTAYFIHDVANDPNYILDYGIVHLSAPIDSTIDYVRNDGDGPLKITRTWFTSDTSEFSIISGGAPALIAPGATGSMVVRFKAKSNGLKMTYLDFKTNDPNTDTSAIASSMQVQADVQKLSVHSSASGEPQLFLSPNPFKGLLQLEVRAGLGYVGKPINVEIFDNLGRKVGTVDGGKLDGQSMKLKWQPDALLSDGAYNIKLKIGDYELLKQVILIK